MTINIYKYVEYFLSFQNQFLTSLKKQTASILVFCLNILKQIKGSILLQFEIVF